MTRYIAGLLFSACLASADVDAVKAITDAERRSDAALAHAEEEISVAKKAYEATNIDGFRKAVEEVGQLVDMSVESLDSTGKRARKSPKYFKRAEQKLLIIMRRLDSLEKDLLAEDRETVAAVRKRVSATHDRVLNDIMTKK